MSDLTVNNELEESMFALLSTCDRCDESASYRALCHKCDGGMNLCTEHAYDAFQFSTVIFPLEACGHICHATLTQFVAFT